MSEQNISYTIEEVAALLKVSKLTVYDLIKKSELTSYRVGRQMRVDSSDLENYKLRTKNNNGVQTPYFAKDSANIINPRKFVISGQDIALDLFAKQLEKDVKDIRPLRLYTGSLNSLMAMYQNQCDLVSLHLFDGDTGTYNIPYVKKILTGFPFIVINFLSRWAGIYVQKGNPKNISGWMDLNRDDISIINREKGSGARVLLDEQLRIHGIRSAEVNGYNNEETSHLAVAAAVKGESADAGIGIEHAAKLIEVDFIPLIKERYDLVLLKTEENHALIEKVIEILSSDSLKNELKMMGDYDLTETGKVIFETF